MNEEQERRRVTTKFKLSFRRPCGFRHGHQHQRASESVRYGRRAPKVPCRHQARAVEAQRRERVAGFGWRLSLRGQEWNQPCRHLEQKLDGGVEKVL